MSEFGCMFGLGLVLALSACNGQGASSDNKVQAQPPAAPVPPGSPPQSLVLAYLNAQSKLAADDLQGSRAALGSVAKAAQSSALTLSDELRKRMVASAERAAAAADLPAVRAAFADLSDALLAWFKGQPNPAATSLSIVHCPMARAGKGANWLQAGEKIKNPYFGTDMLECGTVESTLKPTVPASP
jgi:hypothetical protein